MGSRCLCLKLCLLLQIPGGSGICFMCCVTYVMLDSNHSHLFHESSLW